MLRIREKQVANQFVANRPNMYAELKKSGQLEATAKRMWAEYTAELADLVRSGVPYNQAEEMSRERAFPQSKAISLIWPNGRTGL